MDKELYDKGMVTRRAVLGDAHVDRALETADDFGAAMQEMATSFGWGWLWNRPGLERKTRSLLNLAMLSALNRPHEFKAHVRGAVVNGASREEIREVLLQVGVYCGIPAAIEAHRLAREVLSGMDAENKSG